MEEWVKINDFDGYFANVNGQVKSNKRVILYSNGRTHIHPEKYLKPSISRKGYFRITLFRNLKRYKIMLHRVIALTFIPNPENKPTVNHKDGDKKNNSVSNLEWATQSEQNIHSFSELNRKPTEGKAKKVFQYNMNGNLITVHPSYTSAQKTVGVSKTSILDCVNGRAKTAGGYIWSNT